MKNFAASTIKIWLFWLYGRKQTGWIFKTAKIWFNGKS